MTWWERARGENISISLKSERETHLRSCIQMRSKWGSGLHGSPRRRATIPLSPDISDSALMMRISKRWGRGRGGQFSGGDTRQACLEVVQPSEATVAKTAGLRYNRIGSEREREGERELLRVKTACSHFYPCVTVKTPNSTHG